LGIQRPIHLGRSNKKKIKTYLQDKVFPIKFSSSNCLFGPTKVFYENPFDEHMLFVYEDMDVTMRISAAGYPFYVMLDLYIDHQMREKTPLDQTYI
jgi:GT2 family glycosyltransferase